MYTGERSAVGSKSGQPVPPVRSGAEATYNCTNGWPKTSGSPSPDTSAQTGPGCGAGSSAIEPQREALGSSLTPSVDRAVVALDAFSADTLDDHSIQQLISFFEMLDHWDRELNGEAPQ